VAEVVATSSKTQDLLLLLASPWDIDRLINELGMEHLTRHELVLGFPIHSTGFSVTVANLWQLLERNVAELNDGTRVHWKSLPHVWVGGLGSEMGFWSRSGATAGQVVQRDKERLDRGGSFVGIAPGSRMNETMLYRQSGQGIDPDGANEIAEILFVEQR
jgi:hypothetical protein